MNVIELKYVSSSCWEIIQKQGEVKFSLGYRTTLEEGLEECNKLVSIYIKSGAEISFIRT